jgi:hypothetical protein
MTKEKALNELRTGEEWQDFDYWVTLKLMAMGLSGKELADRMNEEIKIHEVREARLKLHEAEIDLAVTMMRNAGASAEEINKYTALHHRRDLVNDWRSLSSPLIGKHLVVDE